MQEFVDNISSESNLLKDSLDSDGFYTAQLANTIPSVVVSSNNMRSTRHFFDEEPENDLNNFQDPHSNEPNEDIGDEDFQLVEPTEIGAQQNELMRLRIEHERMKIFETRKRIEVINLQKLYWTRQIQLQRIPNLNL
jgi:hypothetical protein